MILHKNIKDESNLFKLFEVGTIFKLKSKYSRDVYSVEEIFNGSKKCYYYKSGHMGIEVSKDILFNHIKSDHLRVWYKDKDMTKYKRLT